MRINEDYLDTVEQDDIITKEEEPQFEGSYDIVIYIDLQNDFKKKDTVASKVLKMLSTTPAVDSAERLKIIFESDNFDHIYTDDAEYKRWNTFIKGKAPNSIAFGIKGNFRGNLRATMSVFINLLAVSANGENFKPVDVLMKDQDKNTACFNVSVIKTLLEYQRTRIWPEDRTGDFSINYIELSKALQYVTGKPMQIVQEFLFSRYAISEIYIARDRRSITQKNIQPFRIAEYATACLRSQTNVLSPDDLYDALRSSGLLEREGYKRYVNEISVRMHVLNDLFQDGAYFDDKTLLNEESDSVLSRTDFPQFAAIATRPSSLHSSSEFEFVVPCQILSFDDEPDDVYIKFITVNTSNTKWMSDILKLLYPDISDEQWKTINSGLCSLI